MKIREMANPWPNRLIGEAFKPKPERVAWLYSPYTDEIVFLPSGLLGPVLILAPEQAAPKL